MVLITRKRCRQQCNSRIELTTKQSYIKTISEMIKLTPEQVLQVAASVPGPDRCDTAKCLMFVPVTLGWQFEQNGFFVPQRKPEQLLVSNISVSARKNKLTTAIVAAKRFFAS